MSLFILVSFGFVGAGRAESLLRETGYVGGDFEILSITAGECALKPFKNSDVMILGERFAKRLGSLFQDTEPLP